METSQGVVKKVLPRETPLMKINLIAEQNTVAAVSRRSWIQDTQKSEII